MRSRRSLEEELAGGVRLIAAPGAGFEYSGGGYMVAQLLVEEATKKGFAEYMRTEIFLPLGMKTAGFEWTEEIPAAARPHDPKGAPTIGPRFTAVSAAGCHMNVTDLARFVIANMPAFRPEGDEEVLGRETLELMQSRAAGTRQYGLGLPDHRRRRPPVPRPHRRQLGLGREDRLPSRSSARASPSR